MKENMCFLKRTWLAVTLIALSLVCYAGIVHQFPLFMARMGSDFQKSFVWLFLGLIVIALITATGRINKTFCNIGLILYFIALVGILLGEFLFGSFVSFGDEIKDPKYYGTVLETAGFEQELIAEFPEQIPVSADAVQFRYQPQLAQGGEYITLKFATDTEQIKKYMTYLERKAVSSGTIRTFTNTPYEQIVKDAGYFYETIPDTYLVYVLSAQRESQDWNHGKCSMVGISQETSEITFYAEEW